VTEVISMKFAVRFLATPIVALVSSLFFCAGVYGADQTADEAAIRNLETRQQEAWNHHDAKA